MSRVSPLQARAPGSTDGSAALPDIHAKEAPTEREPERTKRDGPHRQGWLPDQWYPVFESRRLGRKPIAVQRLGRDWVLWRDAAGRPVAMPDRCPHRGVALSGGRVRDGRLECPFHGFQFDSSGACRLMPCEGAGARIPAGMATSAHTMKEAHGLLWLYWGTPSESLPAIPWFDEFPDDRRGGAGTSKSWPINFVRTVETNFDVHHLPFVHGSLMPGVGARLDPYEVSVEGTHIRTRGELRRPGADSGLAFRVEFKMPALTLFELTPRIIFLVADCPIDATHTWRYARYYVDYVRVPGLHSLISWLFMQVDWVLFQYPQDLRVMRTQVPRLPAERADRLVRADGGTAAYGKLRRRLWAEAERRAAAEGDTLLGEVSRDEGLPRASGQPVVMP